MITVTLMMSLLTGMFQMIFKQNLDCSTTLKKLSLDNEIPSNYNPISNPNSSNMLSSHASLAILPPKPPNPKQPSSSKASTVSQRCVININKSLSCVI